uniref:MI domain-containing protein n=1 Tax=Panagrolaimus sp. JU765 TaxID=591449 RepID=A0AC34QWK7_9BILA
MDIRKLLTTRSARKEARKSKKKLKKIIRQGRGRKQGAEEAVLHALKVKEKQKKSGTKTKKKGKNEDKAPKVSVRSELAPDPEEAAYFKSLHIGKKQALKEGMDEDDAEIRKYEKLLGFDRNKSKNVPTSVIDDGFVDLWEFCDPNTRQKIVEEEDETDLGLGQIAERVDNNDIDLSEGKKDSKKAQRAKKVKFDVELKDNEADDSASDFDEEMDAIDNMLFAEDQSDQENDPTEDENDDAEAETNDDSMEAEETVKEDIYGRKIDIRTGLIIHEGSSKGAQEKLEELNKNDPLVAEQRLKITKTIRGMLNRLNEKTLAAGIKTVEELFEKNSHNDVKSVLTDTFMKSIQTIYLLPDLLLMEYAAFIALVHFNISDEITNHFVEKFAIYLVNEMETNEERDDKSLENATTLICHLFNFKVIKGQFIIDLMTKMRNLTTERSTSLMMSALTFAGTNLKKRMGTVFQSFVTESQNFYHNLPEDKETPRMKFLVEDLLAIKNAVITSLTSKFDESRLDHLGRLFKSLMKGSTKKESEVAFSLDDALHISERGRWWIVGSAWKPVEEKKIPDKKETKTSTKFDGSLLELAKKAKMNTETRRNVFCLIVGSEDDMEAFEKLLKLALKGSQEREIIHIAIFCTMMEANYNQYYSKVIERFCNYDKRFIMTTQFALWDRLKDLGSLKKHQRINLAFLTADLIQMEALPLSALKVINFGIIEPTTTAFLRRVFYRLLSKVTNSQMSTIFKKLTRSDTLNTFVDGLQLFFEISMKPEFFQNEPNAAAVMKRIDLVMNILGSES